MDDIIILEKINKFYGDEVVFQVLFDIHLYIKRGKFTTIVGPSGSGKSTLLNIIGLLESPTSGKVFLDGQDVSSLNKDELAACRNEKIGFIFQFHYLLPEFTAIENILIPYWIGKGRPPGEIVDRALHLMDRIGIKKFSGKYPNQLSGGQQQRVAIARALANDPKVILADEPTGNLDSTTGREIVAILKSLAEKQGKIVVVVTHDGMVASQAQRILQMMDGRIIDDSKIDSDSVVFSHPSV